MSTNSNPTNYYWFQDRPYEPVMVPGGQLLADSDFLASKGDRLMFRHTQSDQVPNLFIAPKGEINHGFVIGVFAA